MKWNEIRRNAALVGAIAMASCSASAQQFGVVRLVATDYVSTPEILFTVAALDKTQAVAVPMIERSDLARAEAPAERSASGGATPLPTWEVSLKDIHLSNTLQRWATDAKWRVRWDASKNVLIEAPDKITGTFEDAIKTLLEAPGIANSAYPLEVCFYPNTPPLARITRKGEQDKDCQ